MSLVTNRWAKRLALLGVCTSLTLAGCAEEQPQNFDALESAEANGEHINELQSWIFPSQEAETARKAFVQRCVTAQGGKYTEADQSFNLSTAIATDLTRDELRKSGYSATKSDKVIVPVSDEAGQKAYFGDASKGTISVSFMGMSTGEIPADGCMAQSYQYIYGKASDGLKVARLAPSFAQAVAESVRSDEAYTNLVSSWSTCMDKAGYSGLETVESASDKALQLPDAKEAKLASADADCREEVRYEETVSDIEHAYYETVYKRLKQFSKEIKTIHETSATKVEEDKTNPKNSSPIDLSTETPTASGSASASSAASSSAESSAGASSTAGASAEASSSAGK